MSLLVRCKVPTITRLSVGLGVVCFFSRVGKQESECSECKMESLTKHWNNLSLNEREGGGVHLRRDRSLNEFIVAAKFLTKRALSIDAIIRTFNPLWRSKRGFEVRNVGDHVMLFVFTEKEEVDRIFAAEPWSFDRHIVLLQRYDKKIPVWELVFNQVAIWIQIHDIPAPFMT